MKPKKAIKENTKFIYIETPTNPMLNITDLNALSKIAKEKILSPAWIILLYESVFSESS